MMLIAVMEGNNEGTKGIAAAVIVQGCYDEAEHGCGVQEWCEIYTSAARAGGKVWAR